MGNRHPAKTQASKGPDLNEVAVNAKPDKSETTASCSSSDVCKNPVPGQDDKNQMFLFSMKEAKIFKQPVKVAKSEFLKTGQEPLVNMVESKSSPNKCSQLSNKYQSDNVPTLDEEQVHLEFAESDVVDMNKKDNVGKQEGASHLTSKLLPQAPNTSQMCTVESCHRIVSVAQSSSDMPIESSEIQRTQELESTANNLRHTMDPGQSLVIQSPKIEDQFVNLCSESQPVKPSTLSHLRYSKVRSPLPVDVQEAEVKDNRVSFKEDRPFIKYLPSSEHKIKMAQAKQDVPLASFPYSDTLKQRLPVKPPLKLFDIRPVVKDQAQSQAIAINISARHEYLVKVEKSLAMKDTTSECRTTKKVKFHITPQEIYPVNAETVQEERTAYQKDKRLQTPIASNKTINQLGFICEGASETVKPPCFTFSTEEPKFNWISYVQLPKNDFHFSGSCTRKRGTQASVPKHSYQSQRRDQLKAVPRIVSTKNVPTSKVQPQRNDGLPGTEKQSLEFETHPGVNPFKAKQNNSPDFIFTGHKVKPDSKPVATFSPQEMDPPTHTSAPSKGPSHNMRDVTKYLVHHSTKNETTVKKRQYKVMPTPPKAIGHSQAKEKDQLSLMTKTNISDWNKPSLPISVPQKKVPQAESADSTKKDHSVLALEKEPWHDLISSLNIQEENTDVENPVVDPDDPPSERCKDSTCSKKCRRKHRPAKLPPNGTRRLPVSQDRQAEPMWITTLKLASTLAAGTKLLLDHHARYVTEDATRTKKSHQKE